MKTGHRGRDRGWDTAAAIPGVGVASPYAGIVTGAGTAVAVGAIVSTSTVRSIKEQLDANVANGIRTEIVPTLAANSRPRRAPRGVARSFYAASLAQHLVNSSSSLIAGTVVRLLASIEGNKIAAHGKPQLDIDDFKDSADKLDLFGDRRGSGGASAMVGASPTSQPNLRPRRSSARSSFTKTRPCPRRAPGDHAGVVGLPAGAPSGAVLAAISAAIWKRKEIARVLKGE